MWGRVQQSPGHLQRPRKKTEGKSDKGVIQSHLVNNPSFFLLFCFPFFPNLIGGILIFFLISRVGDGKLFKEPCGIGFTENKY